MATFHSRQLTETLAGNQTEILIQGFADRILVLVTQLGKVGNLIQTSLPSTIPLENTNNDGEKQEVSTLPSPPAGIQLTPLLGNAQSEHLRTLHGLYASQIATIIWSSEADSALGMMRRNVVVGIALAKTDVQEDYGLTDSERAVFNGVMAMVNTLVRR